VSSGLKQRLARLDKTAATLLTLAGLGGIVAVSARSCDRVVYADHLEQRFREQAAIDHTQDEDLDLLFQTQVRLVTSVENLQQEVREVRRDLRALDAGRPLPPLTPTVPAQQRPEDE
jgi:hypothetical protein